jgi:hypothetical protein
MKAILYTLVRAFELKLAVKEEDVLRMSAYVYDSFHLSLLIVLYRIVTRPMIRGQTERGTQMPLIVRPVAV